MHEQRQERKDPDENAKPAPVSPGAGSSQPAPKADETEKSTGWGFLDSVVKLGRGFIDHCKSTWQPTYKPGGPYYYTGFASYELPFRPTGEITAEQAKKLET